MNLSELKYFQHALIVYKVSGSDAIDLLNRISTNQLNSIGLNQVISSVLTDDKAKIIDVLKLLNIDNSLYMICSNPQTLEWIDKFTFVEDISFEESNFKVLQCLSEETTSDPNKIVALSNQTFQFKDEMNNYFIITETVGDLFGENEVTENDFNLWRSNHIRPSYRHEFSIHFIPTEIGLIDFISFTKGCYTGQEIIARLDSYKKINKRLVSVEGKINGGDDELFLFDASGKKIGRISTFNPDEEIHLAVVHQSVAEAGHNLFLDADQHNAVMVKQIQTVDLYSH